MFDPPIKPSVADTSQQARGWQFGRIAAVRLFNGLKIRGAPPETALGFQQALYRFLEIEPNLRPKNCREGRIDDITSYLSRVLAPRLKFLQTEFSNARMHRFGDSPEFGYRVIEVFVAVRIMLDNLECEIPESSPASSLRDRCSNSAWDGVKSALLAFRKAGRFVDFRDYLTRIDKTGPMPGLSEVHLLEIEVMPAFIGKGPGIADKIRTLLKIAERNVWNRSGQAIVDAVWSYVSDLKGVSQSEQLAVIDLVDTYADRVKRVMSEYFRNVTRAGADADVPREALMALAYNRTALEGSSGQVSLSGVCQSGLLGYAARFLMYPSLVTVEQIAFKTSVSKQLFGAVAKFRSIPTRSYLWTGNPLLDARGDCFQRVPMHSLLRTFAEKADDDTVDEVFPRIFGDSRNLKDHQLVSAIIALRLWGERPHSPSGVECADRETNVVSAVVDGLELFRGKNDSEVIGQINLLVRVLSKDFPTSLAKGLGLLRAELSKSTMAHIVGALCDSGADGSDLRALAAELTYKKVPAGFEDKLRRAPSFEQMQRIVESL